MGDRRKNYRVWDSQQDCQEPVSPRDALPEDDLVCLVNALLISSSDSCPMPAVLTHWWPSPNHKSNFIEFRESGSGGCRAQPDSLVLPPSPEWDCGATWLAVRSIPALARGPSHADTTTPTAPGNGACNTS